MKIRESIKNRLQKQKLNDQGSSFVLVLVSIALVMILVAAIFVMIFVQYRMLELNRQTKDNFYYLEEVLDELRVGIGNESVIQLKKAYDETVSMVVSYDTDQEKYMSVSSETASNIMNTKFLNYIKASYADDSSTDLVNKLLSYVQNVDVSPQNGAYVTNENVSIRFGTDALSYKCEPIMSNNPVQVIGYTMKNITVSRVDDKGNNQSITTDITIYPPEENMDFIGSGIDIDNIFTYSMVADYGLQIDASGAKNEVRIVGNIYAANDMRDNGLYEGTITNTAVSGDASGAFSRKVTPSGTRPTGATDDSKYSGIFVSGKEASLNLQSDIVAVNGSIAANDGASINLNNRAEDSIQSSQAIVWANNIVTLGKEGGKISVNAQTSLSDDLELNADKSDVEIAGMYYGYNYASEEEYQLGITNDDMLSDGKTVNRNYQQYGDQVSASTGKTHTNSSAIIVNGENSKLNLSKLSEMVINGRSYIDLVSENKDVTDTSNLTDYDIKTAESISAKGLQLVYRVLEPRSINNKITTLDTEGTNIVGNTNIADKVPTYNMIKYLTWRFFEDDANKIYANQSAENDLADANWQDKSLKNVWEAIETEGVNCRYYKDIMNFYFPKDKVIVAKTTANGDYSATNNFINYKKVDNTMLDVTDCYGHKYKIWANQGSVPTQLDGADKSKATKSASRYGFLTVGKDYDQIALVKAVVGEKKDVYYYYQFYDDALKERFVLDYEKYCENEDIAVEDVSSKETFPSDSIQLPDADVKTVYTRGISTAIEADAKNYTFKPSQKSSKYDAVTLMSLYEDKVKKANVFKCYFPKNEAAITIAQVNAAQTMFNTGTRPATTSTFKYDTKQNSISPLTNPDCIDMNWSEVTKKQNVSSTNTKGEVLKGYTGARVWLSTKSFELDGADYDDATTSGIIICMGDVTFKNMKSFTGTIIAAGKVYIKGSSNAGATSFFADEQMCNAMIQNDEENMIRTCFGLKEFASQTDEDTEGKSISNIDYTDLVGYENWKKNAE